MVSVSRSTLKITRQPSASPTAIVPGGGGNPPQATFAMTGIEALGEVVLNGAPGDSGAGWEVAFIQAQWIETNWGYYRGSLNQDGSSLVQRARPPARPRQACRDSAVPGAVFYVNNPAQVPIPRTPLAVPVPPFDVPLVPGTVFPKTVRVFHQDIPGDAYDVVRTNAQTGKLNFLNEVQVEFHFCTVLTVKNPANRYTHLHHFYWNVSWQYKFSPSSPAAGANSSFVITPVKSSAHASHVFGGSPSDHRFAGVLTTPQMQNCNQVAVAAATNPVVKEATLWQNFDVRV